MKFIKFFGKCILAASPAILLIVFTLLCPDCYLDEEYPSWRYTMNVVSGKAHVGVNYDTLILGDSGAMSSFAPEVLSGDDSVVNLAVGGGTSLEMYYFLKQYLECHEAPKNIVMMYAPFHYFNIDNYETRTMYFKAIPVKYLSDVYEMAEKCGKQEIYGRDGVWGDISCRLGLPTKYLPAITAAKFVGRYKDNTSSYEKLLASRGYGTFGTLDGCDELSYECSYTAMEPGTDYYLVTLYINAIYMLCWEEGINLTIVQPALNEASYNQLNPNYKMQYEQYLEVLADKLPMVLVETKLRCYPNEYFGDVSHLNEKGAKLFSEEIKELYPDIFGVD